MKIAIIGHKRIPSREGGIEKGVEMHAVRMAERGNSVDVYNRGGNHVFGGKFNRLHQYKKVRIITVPTISGSAEVPIYSFLATIRAIFGHYDVISYRASGSCVMIPLAKLFGIRTIASIHGVDSQRQKWGKFASWYLRLGEKFAATQASECLVLSSAMQKYFQEKYGVKTIRFANGIDQPDHRPLDVMQQKFGLERNQYYLSLGRIVPEKGIHYLIKAFLKTKTSKKLVIAGGDASNGNYYTELRRLAGNDERIIFCGFVNKDQCQELYSNAYSFVLPSDLEGMANALLEAMSFGNCCIVSSIPENTEVVNNKAIVFEKGNVDDLAEKIQFAEDHPHEVDVKKSQAAEYILKKYSWDKVVDQMLDIYSGNIKPYEYYYANGN